MLVRIGTILTLLSWPTTQQHFSYNIDNGSLFRFDKNLHKLRLWMTVSARQRFLEISWQNAPVRESDVILITTWDPDSIDDIKSTSSNSALAQFIFQDEGSGSIVTPEIWLEGITSHYNPMRKVLEQERSSWIPNRDTKKIVAAIQPSARTQWYTTGVPFDIRLLSDINANTRCYGYWASYVSGENLQIIAKTCLRAYPRWMQDIRSVISDLRMRDLFIVGTHDSGSYRPNFNPLKNETIITKYTLTQDEDIRSQLIHGARYLDIRVGYYRKTSEKFFINHGVTRHRPLLEVIKQVKEFVSETNEIIIFGLKEFPIGFGRTLNVHRQLVQYLQKYFGKFIVHPSITWQTSLHDIWSRQQNVILAYDNLAVVQEFPNVIFNSVEQRWGNVQNWSSLEHHLKKVNTYDPLRFSSRPVADMAELTPDTWGVIFDKYGGLRKMADNVNWRLSQLYRNVLGTNANIVAVDFMLGTNLMDISMDFNQEKYKSVLIEF